MNGGILTGALLLWVVPIFVAYSQGKAKNRAGFVYGFFLGWVGVIILAVLPRLGGADEGECPWCKATISVRALVCPHCQRDVMPLDEHGEPDYSARPAE